MEYPKFIIQNNKLLLGVVEFHYELKEDNSFVSGGGWFNEKNFVIKFWKESKDFGKASALNIQNCIDNKQVWLNGKNISDDYKFIIAV